MENDYPELSIANMPMLNEVCVWTLPFPPGGVNVDTTGSPNVEFQDCSNDIEKNETTEFSVYPNPSSGLFTIETNFGDDYLIEVYSPKGHKVYEESSHGKKQQIDLSSFPQGMYLIGISFRNSTAWKKVITL